jgi:hypothetical protein
MVQLFKKVGSDISRFGKKVGGDVSKVFKKGGQAEQLVKKAGVGLSSAGSQIAKYSKGAEDVLRKVEGSPLGKFIPSPILGTAQALVQSGKLLGSAGRQAKGVSKDLLSGKSAGNIAGNILEKATKIKEEGDKIKFA